MRVIHVGEYVNGGVATYIREILTYQVREESIEEISLIISDYNSELIKSEGKIKVYSYKYKRYNMFYLLRSILIMRKFIREKRPDIVHIHSTFAGLIARISLFFFFRKKPKLIYCAHGWSFLIPTNKLKRLIFFIIEYILSLNTDLIINISNYEYVQSTKFGIPLKKSTIIKNGISIKEKSKHVSSALNAKTEPLSLNSKNINLLFVGRLDKAKGVDILVDFFDKYMTNKQVDLYLIGSPVLNDTKVNVPHNVHLLGWIDNDEIDDYYQLFDAVIIPSRWEGFGLVALEAMRNKKALIVSNRGALPELIINGYNGYIFDLDNLKTLEKILNNIDRNILKKMGMNGYNHFILNYTSDRMNKELLQAYKKLLTS